MMYRPSFSQLVERFGEVMAWQCLVEFERAARIQPQRSIADPEVRLAIALRTQDAMCEPKLNIAA